TDEWLHRRTRGHEKLMDMSGKRTKIMAGLIIAEADLKSDKLIRTTLSIKDNYIDDIVISGDFFMMPSDSLPNLENTLKGKKVDREELLTAVNGFFAAGPKVFGIKPGDIVEVIFKARDNSVGVVG
ncbi:MAG TPA: lipoate protein ligase C-terminal domain-containing protein, partial [Caldisericia bacterium]|nr:lipoate protein ligase C-terminal domain-containing protein [Caldisericia bacterium]